MGGKTVVSWSGGKDSSLTIYSLYRMGFDVEGVLVTVDSTSKRVTSHRVPLEAVEAQARAAGLELHIAWLPGDLPSEEVYRSIVLGTLRELRMEGYRYIGHGDVFLWDMIEYKRRLAEKAGLEAVYPLVGFGSRGVVEAFFTLGFEALVVSVDTARLPGWLACSRFSREFVESLPSTVDVAGEYGEFHTLVYNAPFFHEPLRPSVTGVYREGWRSLCEVSLGPWRRGASLSHP
ncbi:conserved hypothetical protein [Aeropyrum pernix]|uniref:Diphthamide synthase domain-containing protein n=1 Tax=Aeropyrum pernix TaxID=56636 RepID=A0A401H9U7_AERPX|nr:diphthine--ammonia ligase family protein [Aeropyrum pernix]GBF09173.1 conserved hypothetical protein [Aeropyrum pernix]